MSPRPSNPTPHSSGLSRGILVGLVLVFFGPLVLAAILYSYHEQLPLPGADSYGRLIDPPRHLKQFATETLAGEALGLPFFEGKWTLVYLGEGDCGLYCAANLYKIRQVRRALGKDSGRVQRLYLTGEGGGGHARRAAVLARHPRLTVAHLKTASAAEALAGLPAGSIVVVDPHRNAMMRYPRDARAKGILKDLKKLLRASQIG